MEKLIELPNFIEVDNVVEANKIDLEVYTFVGWEKGIYCFKIRQKK